MTEMTVDMDNPVSSRLVVKNLPNTTEEKLTQLFSQKGEVTDVRLKYDAEGNFRHFAFVGFRTVEQAQQAQEYFHRTYIGAAKIDIEFCKNKAEKPRPVSKVVRTKLRAEKEKERKREKAKTGEDEEQPVQKKIRKEDEILEKCEQDPAFLEFLQAHKKSTATWGNDTLVDELMKMKKSTGQKQETPVEEASSETATSSKKKPKVEFFTLKLRNVPKKAKKKDIKTFFHPFKFKSIRFPANCRGIVYVGFPEKEDLQKALQKNKSILFGNQIKITIYNKEEFEEPKPKTKFEILREELDQTAEAIEETGRIYVRNLPYTTNEDEITKLFEEFGPLTEVHLPIDKITRKLKGFGFITFMLPEHALNAFQALDGTIFQGRILHLLPAKLQDDTATEEINAGSSYKTKKEQKQKKTAGSSHNWNALFLGPDAVSKVISQKYGVSREEMLLDKNDDQDKNLASIGVRMALAETEIVSETKKFLEENGVCLDAFDSADKKPERSKTVMLAKNLPPGTVPDDLKNLFLKHGVLSRIVLPPSGVTGIVEFAEPAEARAAFKKLAYSKFFNSPLYLEWAPIGVFERPANSQELSKLKAEKESIKSKSDEKVSEKPDPVAQILQQTVEPLDENAVPELDTTLFVKNLNFRTVEETLKKHFLDCGPVYAVTVARKKDPNNSEAMLSMGYGFVQYYRSVDAEKAMTTLNGTMLDNHILEIKRSSRTLMKENATDATKKKGNGTKILVRNVPFLATQEEITDLFKTFGKLKAVRLPKKLTGSGEHRGFAFIEYHSDSDAKKAFDTLCKSTHLYGRRLVLEWAAQDETIEDLRAKTARLASASKVVDEEAAALGDSTKRKLQRYFQTQQSKASKNDEDDEDED